MVDKHSLYEQLKKDYLRDVVELDSVLPEEETLPQQVDGAST
jgi:hypothetical protein